MTSPDSNWLSRLLRRDRRPHEDDLHTCAACGKDFVNPVEWEPVSPEAWWMRLRCGNCDGFPCVVHAKSDAEVLGVRPALEYANVTLLTNATATRLETSNTGRSVTEVIVEHEGQEERFAGDIVVV